MSIRTVSTYDLYIVQASFDGILAKKIIKISGDLHVAPHGTLGAEIPCYAYGIFILNLHD